jgi:hypothetical protein
VKKNVGTVDRVIRGLAALTIGVLLAAGVLKGTAGIVLGILAVGLLATSAAAFCPLYWILGISTRKSGKGA